MGDTGGAGGAGGGKGLAGGGGQVRRTIGSENLRTGDEVYFTNPDKREMKRRRKSYREYIERGGTPTYERSMSVDRLRVKVTKVLDKGKGYKLEIKRGSEQLVEKFTPKASRGAKRRATRTVTAGASELRGGTALRDGKWRYKVKT